jgi:hypothetical protein
MNFFTLLSNLVDNLSYLILSLSILIIYIIDEFYLSYLIIHLNFWVSVTIYLMENNVSSYFFYFIDLHLDSDINIFDLIFRFVSYSYITYFFNLLNNMFYYMFTEIMYSSFLISIKFIVLIALLVFVRGGIPRYRFDYLTKLGWTKFLSLILLSFLLELYLIWIF